MSRAKRAPAKPWSKSKAAARIVTPDQQWAARIIRRMLLDCHPWQRDAVIDPARRMSMLVGRGGAKTTTMRVRALIKLLWLPGQRIGYAATTADHARELNWDKLKDVCENYGIRTTGTSPDVSFLDTKMIMRCHRTGSVYRLRGVEDKRDAEKFRGFPQAEFDADEVGSFPPELLVYLLNQCVAPRLGEALALPPGFLRWLLEQDDEDLEIPAKFSVEHRGGCIAVGSTPPSQWRGEFYEITAPGSGGSDRHRRYADRDKPEYANWLGYSSHAWTLKDVVELPKSRKLYPALVANWEEALLEKAEKKWGDDHPIWRREYLGEWSSDNTTTVFRYRAMVDGKPWNQWDPFGGRPLEGLESLKIAIAALPEDVGTWRYIIAMDTGGTRDPFACNAFAFAPADRDRRMIHVFAFERMGMYARTEAELLLGPNRDPRAPEGLIGVIGWPDAIELDGEQPHLDELSNVYGIRAKKGERKADYKFGSIELVNGDLVEGRILILKGSPLEKQMESLQWKADEYGMLREDKAQPNHSTDCVILARRALANLFESGAVVAEGARPVATEGPEFPVERRRDRFDDLESLLVAGDFDDADGGSLL